jgi:hypothetical protein
LTRE